ncbi:MAG: DUF1736 domain-containing protein [Bacteroidales bacterium]|jgi:hypothetical protein|nr:DUF1736 domain-containing protein [Bacteroidales bacterium]
MKRVKGHTRPLQHRKRTSPKKKKLPKKGEIAPPKSGRANHYLGLFFFAFAWLLYGNTIVGHPVTDNLLIPGISGTQPIVNMTFAIEHFLWGEKTIYSHVVNVIIYALLSMLLFFTLKRMLKNYNILFPFLITVVFTAHPVHTEVVANLNYRDEMLAFFCGIGGLWFFLHYAERRKIRFLLYAALIFITGYLCKSSILPFLALYALVLYFFTGIPIRKNLLMILGILLAGLTAHILILVVFHPLPGFHDFIENPLFIEKNFWIRIGTSWVTLLFYLRILFYPIPLLYYYGYDMIPVTNLANMRVVLSVLLYLILFTVAFWKFRKKSFLSFAILWYILAILFYSNVLFPVAGIVGERFVFNASLGFCMAFIGVVFLIFKTDPKSLTIEIDVRLKILASVILVIIPYATLTLARNNEWRSLNNLYAGDIKFLDRSVKANIDLGNFYLAQTDTTKAIRYLEKAIAIWPDSSRCMQLRALYIQKGEEQKAAYFRRLSEQLHLQQQ